MGGEPPLEADRPPRHAASPGIDRPRDLLRRGGLGNRVSPPGQRGGGRDPAKGQEGDGKRRPGERKKSFAEQQPVGGAETVEARQAKQRHGSGLQAKAAERQMLVPSGR